MNQQYSPNQQGTPQGQPTPQPGPHYPQQPYQPSQPQPQTRYPPQYGQQLPYGYQGQPGYYPPPPRKKGAGGWIACLVLALLSVCICLCLTIVILFGLGKISIDFLEPYRQQLMQLISEYGGTATVEPPISTANSLTLTSGEGGTVATSGGASMTIPPAAVPRMESGSNGTMVFTISEDPSIVPQMPQGYSSAGPVYQLGPEGFTFTVPITITLPVPVDVDLDAVLGLAYLDTATSKWMLVPGTVDTSNRTVSASVTHLSAWTIFGSCLDSSSDCNGSASASSWKNEFGGIVRVENTHLYETDRYAEEDGTGLPITTTYGVCIAGYSLSDPDIENSWIKPDDWKMLVSDYYFPGGSKQVHPPVDWWLPVGQYTLIEVLSVSEVNHSPFYVPAYADFWRQTGQYSVNPGSTNEFVFHGSDYNNGSWTKGRPPCFGAVDTSVGTGDVQVTLTWQTNDDIDLYVIDPDGTTIYYNNVTAPSGGQLDRDNLCMDMIVGRPENIFWPGSGAPSGEYRVQVNYYGACEIEKPVPWTVRVVHMGTTETFTGTLTTVSETQDVTTFTIP